MKKLDLSGERFGRLTAVKDSGKRCGGFVVWECLCDCGRTTYVTSNRLKQGVTKSCGCLASESAQKILGEIRRQKYGSENGRDLQGKKFGRLTVIGLAGKRSSDGINVWECICECGNRTCTPAVNLINGKATSCGCFRNERRLAACRSEPVRKKQRDSSIKRWPETARTLGMQDDTNVSIIKSKKARADSSTGVRGVVSHNGKYMAILTFQKKTYREYGFSTIEEAGKARERMYESIVIPYLDSIGEK